VGFIRNFANLTGYKLGTFRIDGLVGRDAAGYPKWRVICGKCGQEQIVSHSKLAPLIESKAVGNFQCANGACELSRTHRHSETLADVRRQERREAEQAGKHTPEEQEIARERAVWASREVELKAEWAEYFRHQIGTQAANEDIIPFCRWQKFTPETRKMILDALRKDPTAFFKGIS
jgi:hypothetical protein